MNAHTWYIAYTWYILCLVCTWYFFSAYEYVVVASPIVSIPVHVTQSFGGPLTNAARVVQTSFESEMMFDELLGRPLNLWRCLILGGICFHVEWMNISSMLAKYYRRKPKKKMNKSSYRNKPRTTLVAFVNGIKKYSMLHWKQHYQS